MMSAIFWMLMLAILVLSTANEGITISFTSRLRSRIEVAYGGKPITPLPSFTEDSIFLVFPGAGGPDANTDRLTKVVGESDSELGHARFLHCFDWREWKGNIFRAAFDGQRVGRAIGKQLAKMSSPPKEIHVVGISVGAFAADACVKEFHKQLALDENDKGRSSRLTLLCAFQSRGVFQPGYGIAHFGEGATFCEQFVTLDGKSIYVYL